MLKIFFASFIGIVFFAGCKKEHTTNCTGCHLIGTYPGTFRQTAGCYACSPYLDSMFAGSFLVDTLHTDSIIITRSYDNYQWRFSFADSSVYSRWACCTVGESFTFTSTDSLKYFYNNGGSGGYFREEFTGKRE